MLFVIEIYDTLCRYLIYWEYCICGSEGETLMKEIIQESNSFQATLYTQR